jgi:starch-binding outer membrane protein, SusD/RagB family
MYKKACTTLAAAGVLLFGAAGCTDLTVEPRSTAAGETAFNDPGAYRAFLGRLYTGLAVTGQQAAGGAGAADISGIDEGFSQYLRLLWQMQTLPTEEAVLGWGDGSIQELNRHDWTPNNEFLTAMYYRVFFQVTLANEFLRETSEDRLAQRGVSQALRTEIQRYRAEARFLRALSYWHGMDLFGNIPLITEADPIGATPPAQSTRQAVYDFVVQELTQIREQMLPTPPYGRASQAAADMLLAKVYMNAAVYTGTARWSEARVASERVIAGPYQLASSYMHNFLADNHTSPEIVFSVPFDGQRTRTWGGMTFLTHAAVGNQMNAADYGIPGGGWWGLRVTPQFVALFPGVQGPDQRASILFTQGQQLEISNLGEFSHGYAAPKFRNRTRTGQQGSHATFPDIDFPMFRLADAYLMYAEAHLRGGGGSAGQALTYVNQIRQRAHGNTSGNITAAQLTLDFIINERARELFWEGHRRTDLIRFGRFTTGNYHWAWKGGIQQGRETAAFRNLYPLPASELLANPNLTQNPGYQN